MVANKEQEEAEKIIDNVPKTQPFESRYNNGVKTIDWESCQTVLDKKEMRIGPRCQAHLTYGPWPKMVSMPS
ncbi:hypothetical protein [Acetobacterium fimetarium]|uniref:hypothetical protein n=1 Tax=Acetobacterium fimetarium TaxID=52691 RepID=UPI001FABF9AB|nr:hypothetical protein [Acetobacterium fimetarium]